MTDFQNLWGSVDVTVGSLNFHGLGTSYSKGEQRMRCTSVFAPNSPERKESHSFTDERTSGLSGWAMCMAEEEREGLAHSAVRRHIQTFR